MELPVFTTAADMRSWSRQMRKEGKRIALVPTMGYLHEGHLSLVEKAKGLADIVVASIYVNPTQFAAHEDFDVYPRDASEDRRKLQSAGVAAVFEPTSLYHAVPGQQGDSGNVVGREGGHPDSHETYVQVVSKLFHVVEPDVAVFGQKDYQQWRVITRMVRDLDFAVEVVGCPICREPDNLAMSSRNARLSPEARQNALSIYRGLQWARDAHASGQVTQPEQVTEHVAAMITEAGGKVDYVSIVDADHLGPVTDLTSRPVLLAVAAHFPAKDVGTVRLIDNVVLGGSA